ncbi:MAG: NADH-quinone oxidoreductase subunit D [Actinomycetota bacterium]|nr:NADH-quinone oxidoreductase subunit D [Actinomycetota bacterium]
MSDTPNVVTGDLEAPTTEPPEQAEAPSSPSADARRETHDMWVAGTEEPAWMRDATNERAQEMLEADSDPALEIHRGITVEDDFILDDSADVDELQILNMGPQHPSTHGVLRLHLELDGETIRRVKPIIGYLHTGMEKTAETLTYMQGSTNVTRMDYLSPLHMELAFSLAVESLLGIEIPERAQAMRVLLTELNRVSSHLVWAATQGTDLGAVSMMIYGFRDREYILEFFEKTTGLRMNHNFIRPGGLAADLPDGWEEDIEQIIVKVSAGVAEYEELFNGNPIFQDRTMGVGVITPEECNALGVTGPMARAAGIKWDLRKAFPYSGIEKYDFDVPTGKHGDVWDRYLVRMEEIKQSLGIVQQVMETMPAGDYRTTDRKVSPPPRKRIDESMEALIHHFKLYTSGFKVPVGETYQAIESPRGELGMYIVSDGRERPWRMHARTPSFNHVQALPTMMTDSLVADIVATIASADPVLGDVDR